MAIRRRIGYLLRLLPVMITVTFVSACGEKGSTVDYDKDFEDSVDSFVSNGGGELELKDLVVGDWDRVRILSSDAHTREHLEELFGHPLDMPDYFLGDGSILLFLNDDRVERGVVTSQYFQPGTYSRLAKIAYRPPPNEDFRIKEPAA